jgi:hypothetical protein
MASGIVMIRFTHGVFAPSFLANPLIGQGPSTHDSFDPNPSKHAIKITTIRSAGAQPIDSQTEIDSRWQAKQTASQSISKLSASPESALGYIP